MPFPQSPWPFDRPDPLPDMLHEQGIEPEEVDTLLPALHRLSEWQAPQPSLADTQRLLAKLTPYIPSVSLVREAIHEHRQRYDSTISWLLEIARTQVDLFGMTFWVVSALVTIIGAMAVFSTDLPKQEVLLGACGPFLAYIGTVIAFRGIEGEVLECELVCLPSPVQLTIARLMIILGYDFCLGLVLGFMLWIGGTGQVLMLLLSWFMPLLLVTGLAFLLSLQLPVQIAATLAYISWLIVLVFNVIEPFHLFPITPFSEVFFGSIGLLLLIIALLRLRIDMYRLVPRV